MVAEGGIRKLSIKISYDQKLGRWHFSYRPHLFVTIGKTFLVGGIAVLAAPWWLSIASFFFGKIGVNFDASDNYYVAFTLIAVGLLFLAFYFFVLEKWVKRQEIDKETINKSPPAEQDVQRYFEKLLSDHSYLSSDDSYFHLEYTRFTGSKALQDKKTAELFKSFSKNAKSLHEFVIHNFSQFPDNQYSTSDYRYCLAPELSIDRGMRTHDAEKNKKYDKLASELSNRIQETRRSYGDFIERIKQLGYL